MQIEKWLVACTVAACAHAGAQTTTPVTLQQVLDAARNNADVAMAGQALDAARADVLAADHAPLPVLSAKAASIDLQNGLGPGNVLTRKRIDKSVGLDWTWERGNKRALRTQAAQHAVDAARADVDDVKVQQLQAAQDAFWDLLAAQEKLVQVRAISGNTSRIAGNARRRVQAGDLAAQDALRTHIEAARGEADVQSADLDVSRAALVLQQVARLRLPAGSARADATWPPLGRAVVDPDGNIEGLADSRPEVRAAQARVLAAQAGLDVAAAQKSTDVTWGASFDHYPGTSNRLVELRVQVPLQWGYGYQGEIGRAQAQLAQAREQFDKTRLATVSDLQRLALEVRNAADRANRYEKDILPRAQQAGQAAQLAFDRGAMPLSDLLDTQRTLRATQLEAIAARADHAKALGAWQLRTSDAALAVVPSTAPALNTAP